MVAKRKKRKATLTSRALRKHKEAVKAKKKINANKCKKIIIPGPWTEIEPKLEVEVKIRMSESVTGDKIKGSYTRKSDWDERAWYPIYINITSKGITKDVKKHGVDQYMAACEKYLNSTKELKKELGTIVLLSVMADHSLAYRVKDRFMSCYAKTTKKNISGFATIFKGKYTVIE